MQVMCEFEIEIFKIKFMIPKDILPNEIHSANQNKRKVILLPNI